jgi:hypothetical protein
VQAEGAAMFHIRSPKRRSLTVVAVGSDVAAFEGVAHYLAPKVWFRSVRGLREAFVRSAAADVLIFYPDELAPHEAQRFTLQAISNVTLSLIIVVTEHKERFLGLTRWHGAINRVIVLAPPVWPWELFATIQSALPQIGREYSPVV